MRVALDSIEITLSGSIVATEFIYLAAIGLFTIIGYNVEGEQLVRPDLKFVPLRPFMPIGGK